MFVVAWRGVLVAALCCSARGLGRLRLPTGTCRPDRVSECVRAGGAAAFVAAAPTAQAGARWQVAACENCVECQITNLA